MQAKGKVHKYMDNVDTDVIIPARYLNTSVPAELAAHCMEDIDAAFVKNVKEGDIMVAHNNFGCGSSREHAPIAIKASGISCVIAATFARIFYRTAINIGLPILGTPADAIDEAEDRERFDELLERCGIPRPEGRTVFTLDEALQAAQEVGYPVLMRPSYVLGGQNMIVAYNSADVIEYMGVITEHVDMSHPVLMG